MKYFFFLLLLTLKTFAAEFTESLAFRGQATTGTLLNGLVAAWSFDEMQNSGSRTAQLGSFTLVDPYANVGSMRGVMGGACTLTNGSSPPHFLMIAAHNPTFSAGPGKSFTMAVWTIGANANNAFIEVGDTNSTGNFDWRLDGGADVDFVDSVGTQHAVGGISFDSSVWSLWVIGFNSPTHQMFYSLNGAPKTLVSLGGLDVRDTPTYELILQWILGGIDEFYFWNRMLTDSEITQLHGNGGYGNKYPFNSNDPALSWTLAYEWAVTNQSGYVTGASSNGVYQYIKSCINAGIWDKFNMVVGFCPDTLQAALLPIKTTWQVAPGNDTISPLWSPYSRNQGYTLSDLSVNGLRGATAAPASKFAYTMALNQVVNAPGHWPNVNDAGFSIALPAAGQEAQAFQFGFYDNGISPIDGARFMVNSNNITAAIMGDENGVLIEPPGTPAAGLYSVNRDSSTSAKMFFFSQATPNGTTVSTNASNSHSTFRGVTVDIGCENLITAGDYYGSSNWLSYLATHTHLTLADSSNEFGAVTLMRNAFGGGLPNDVSTQPTNAVVLFGNNHTFVGAATSATAYQWNKNGADIAGATQSSYTVSGAALSDFGTYYVTFTEPTGPIISQKVQLSTVTTTTVSNWIVSAVDVNGAPNISSNTIWGVDQFWNGCVTDSISSKIVAINLMVPDSLTACTTPLISPGAYLWVNHNFVDADLTVNGLKGDGGSKYLDPGITPANFTTLQAGLSCYSYTASTGSGNTIEMGNYITGGGTLLLSSGFQFNGGSIGQNQSVDANRIIVTYQGNGYYSDIRTSSSSETMYFANSGHAHASVGVNSTATSSVLGTQKLFVFAISADYTGGAATTFSDARVSVFAFMNNFTGTDSANLYGREQTVRTVFGGGFR